MLGFERLASTVVWCCLVVVNWLNAQFVHPVAEWCLSSVLGTWEESAKSLLREFSAQSIRIVNYVLNLLFGWFPGYQSTKATNEKPSAWQSWWAENRQSTFNAIIDRDRSMRGGPEGPSHQSRPEGHIRRSEIGLKPDEQQHHWWSSLYMQCLPSFLQSSSKTANAESVSHHKKRKPDAEAKGKHDKRIPAVKKLKRNGSDLFDRPAGWAVQEKTKRGFLEDWRIGMELAITSIFDAVRWIVRKLLFMPEKQALPPWGVDGRHTGLLEDPEDGDNSPGPHQGGNLRRTNSFSNWEALHNVWTAAEVIKAAGYPLEQHTVITSDGYKLRMERLPRSGGRDVVFFMHGILDTSMGWVSNGVTGSQAFAAFDQGFDIWLGNSRANPPREHIDPDKMGAKYWHFNVNHLGQQDIEAQLDFIHTVKCAEVAKQPSEAAPAADVHHRRPHYKVRRVTSEPDVKGMPSAPAQASTAELTQTQKVEEDLPSTDQQAAPSSPAGSEQQPGMEAEPRSRRYGLFQGLRKRNKSESQASPHAFTSFSLWTAKPPSSLRPQSIAESDHDGNESNDVFASPRSELEGSSPEPADSRPLSPSLEANGNPSPASQMPQAALQHPSHQIPIQSAEGPEAPEVPHSPFEQMSNGTAVGQMPSQPMSIPSPSQQPAILQSPVSSSAPADSRQHVHHWAGLSRQGNDNASAHQLPQASPAGQHEQAASSTVATAGKGSQPAPRHSALHASSSSKGRSDGRADGGHSIRWNDSQDSLWSSQEDLAQLVPDRASKDGVEQSPEAVSFTGESVSRRSSNGFDALSAPPAVNTAEMQLDHETDQEAAADGDLVAAEQSKVKGEHSSKPSSRRSSRSGAKPSLSQSGEAQEPYRLRAVGHSLGGASLLIYAVMRCLHRQPTHLTRLILLTPAGFQQNYPKAATPFLWILPPLVWALQWLRPNTGAACYIPSSLLRYITFKLTVDMQQIPALNELVRAGLRVLLNGDSSQWDRAMQMPHYNTRSMPSISFHTGMHLIQWIRTGRFQLFNYKSAEANKATYGGQSTPPDIAGNYKVLKMPIDIMAGKSDGVIAKENVLMHYKKLQEANCSVTYKEFDFGHLDFTFAVKDDLRHYVLSRLLMDS